MQITSYFVGIHLEREIFVTLFVRLQQYIKKHNLEDTLIIQNILSLHISLYYFDTSLSEKQQISIKKDSEQLSLAYGNSKILLDKVSYFTNGTEDTLCYLSCLPMEILEEMHSFFVKKYQFTNVPENQYTYIPHISLFTILDSEKFVIHKKKMSQILTEELEILKNYPLKGSIKLFKVNSFFSPEIQISL